MDSLIGTLIKRQLRLKKKTILLKRSSISFHQHSFTENLNFSAKFLAGNFECNADRYEDGENYADVEGHGGSLLRLEKEKKKISLNRCSSTFHQHVFTGNIVLAGNLNL